MSTRLSSISNALSLGIRISEEDSGRLAQIRELFAELAPELRREILAELIRKV